VKRAPFLGASAAVLLAGCGGSHAMRALPGVAPLSTKPSSSGGRLIPATADPIPDNVLARPIIGEARRFDGTVAPNGWAFAQGQPLDVAQNPQLFSMLGTIAGGDGKTVFKLPKLNVSTVIALAGMRPTSPAMLAQSGRRMTHTDSLGPNAVARVPRMPAPPSQQSLAARRMITAQVRVGAANPVRMRPELLDRIVRARNDARAAAVEQLSAGNRALLDSAAQRYLSGRIALYDAVTEMRAALTNGEADALVRIQSDMTRQFASVPGDRPADPRGEASRFLFIVTITDDQIAAATGRGIDLR
jgi:hypothetical protein